MTVPRGPTVVPLAGDPAVLIACSGGPDSVALTHLVVESGARAVAVAHVDHRLRPDSMDDARVAEGHAAALRVPWRYAAVDVVKGRSIEEGARTARWSALRRMAADLGADVIATGHSADDQAETVLMRLARGSGITGLAAMGERDGDIWRPLLGWRRAALRAVCEERGWAFAEDPTNLDRRFERNRVRLDVLPLLGERAVPSLARLARLAADDEDLLETLAAGAPVNVSEEGSTATIELDWLAGTHRALARRAVRRAARLAGAPYPPPADRIDDALAGRGGDLGGGLHARRENGFLVLLYKAQ
jgi:tRNA(Ile)-lysidine synthase